MIPFRPSRRTEPRHPPLPLAGRTAGDPSATDPSTPTGQVLTMRPLAEWERTNPGTVHDPEWFRRDVLPRLAGVKLVEIAKATGLSKSYAS